MRARPGGARARHERRRASARRDRGAPAAAAGHRRRSGLWSLTVPARPGREFFAVRTVGEALEGFLPARRTGVERIALRSAHGRVPAEDTYGASEGLPSYLDLMGEAAMGRPPEVSLRPAAAVAIATGAPLPPGADAVVKIEHTQAATAELIEVTRPAAPGEGMVRADEDASPGAQLVPAGRPLRAHEVGLLAAAGVMEIEVFERPRVAIVSTGDELVGPARRELDTGQVRDATAVALAALVREAGGEPLLAGIIPDDRAALEAALRAALRGLTPSPGGMGSDPADVVVVSAGSSVGARDETAAAVSAVAEIWCHGLALRPGKPTLLADCGGVPLVGLPGNPRSALVVFRLLGIPIVRAVGGCTEAPPEPVVRARLARDLPSEAGRLDVVQVRVASGAATPLFGSSSLL